jgi:ABC-type sugar transport system permease subunit
MENLTHLPKLGSWKSVRRMTPGARREALQGLAFISPWLIGFLVFTLIPMLATFAFTFLNLKITDGILNPTKFVGLQNYANLVKDSQVWSPTDNPRGSLWITLRFALIALPIGLILPLGIALLMNNKHLAGKNFFRSMFYMPYIIPFVASVFLWGGVLNPESGWINRSLLAMGVPKAVLPGWANDINWVYPTYVIMGIWGIGNAMLTMLASMQSVPTELYEAARMDGASSWDSFRAVTFPLISPVIFYNLVLSVVFLFQFFLVPLVINQGTGAPGGASMFMNLYIYKTFFTYGNMSYGATLAWTLFLFILLVTIVLFYTAKYWVYYAGESR